MPFGDLLQNGVLTIMIVIMVMSLYTIMHHEVIALQSPIYLYKYDKTVRT